MSGGEDRLELDMLVASDGLGLPESVGETLFIFVYTKRKNIVFQNKRSKHTAELVSFIL